MSKAALAACPSALVSVPTRGELEALSPGDLWTVAERATEIGGLAWEVADERLRHWVEGEGKTQTEIAKLVGRAQASISERCRRLGIQPASHRGRPRNIGPDNSADEEVIDAEVVEDGVRRVERFILSGEARKVVEDFDRGQQVLSGGRLMVLKAPSPGRTLDHQLRHSRKHRRAVRRGEYTPEVSNLGGGRTSRQVETEPRDMEVRSGKGQWQMIQAEKAVA